MKLLAIHALAALGIAAAPFATQAACTDGEIDASILSNKLVCAYKPDSGGKDPNRRWSEIHNTAADGGGQAPLGEHGRGSSDSAGSYDPDIGTWEYTGNSVTYRYTDDPGSTYTHTLHGTDANSPTSFCEGTTEMAVINSVINIPAAAASNPCTW
jgi:hypothetical protein